MMRKTKLLRVITLGLLLSGYHANCVSAAWTPISTGTSNVGGNLVVDNNYVLATGGVVLNAVGDVSIKTTMDSAAVLGSHTNAATITFNGNGHNITFEGEAGNTSFAANIKDYASDVTISVVGAENIYANIPTKGNVFTYEANGNNNHITLDANNNIELNSSSTTEPILVGKNGTKGSLEATAGNDIILKGGNNVINATGDNLIDLKAGRDIVLTSDVASYPASYSIAGATINIDAGRDVAITAKGAGIGVFSGTTPAVTQTNVTAGNKITITTSYNGVFAHTNATAYLEAKNDISITSTDDMAAYAMKDSTLKLASDKNINITSNKDSALYGYNAGHIKLESGEDVNIAGTQGTVYIAGNAGGIAPSDLEINAGKDINIVDATSASSSNVGGVHVYFPGSKATFTSKGNFNLTNTAGSYAGLTNAGGTVAIEAGKDVNIGGKTLMGIYTYGSGVTDITAGDNKTITITSVNPAASWNNGIYVAHTGSQVNLHSNTKLLVSDIGAEVSIGAITFAKGLEITGAPQALLARSGGTISAVSTADAKVVEGDMASDGAGSSIKVNFDTADSYFTGASAVTNTGGIALDFDKGGLWNVTKSSTLSDLTNNSLVNMRYSGQGIYENVETTTLAGNGEFNFNTDLQASKDNLNVNQNSDKLFINGASSGDFTINIEDASLINGKKAEGYVLLVEDRTSGTATFKGGNLAKSGLYKYTPLILDINPGDNPNIEDTYAGVPTANVRNWYLTGYEKSGELLPVVKPLIGANANRYANLLFEQDNLLLRLGELRDTTPNTEGVWARIKHAQGDVKDSGSSKFTMYQLGYDRQYKKNEKGRRYWGVAFDHIAASQEYDGISRGESGTNSLTLYDTWLGNKGHYLDLVGKVGKMQGDWDYINARFPDHGETGAWYYRLSGEYGRKKIRDDGYYTEPQAQLTYTHINGDNYTSNGGINVDQSAINSLIGRVGFTVGRHYNGDTLDKRSNVYAKLFFNHEFMGRAGVSMLDTYGDSYTHRTDFGGNWWTLGIGANTQLDKKTNAYIDLQKYIGAGIDHNWQINVGIRWAFGGPKKNKVTPVEKVEVVEPAPLPVHESYLDSVHFAFDEDIPLPGEQAKIEHFAQVAKENPDRTYAMVGNTDSMGTDAYNEDLSKRRVTNVKKEAEKLGVPAVQMADSYRGEAEPVESNDTAAGRAANRRVDIYEHK